MPRVRMPDGSVIDVGVDALFADDGTTPFSPGQFTQADLDSARELARQQEKDKLYGRLDDNKKALDDLRAQVGSLTAAEQRREAQLEEERQALEAERRELEEKDLDAHGLIARKEQEWQQSLTETRTSLEQRLEEEKQARLTAEAVAAKEREFNNLREYISAQVDANRENIAPELMDWVGGNSREEVDANVARAIETTNRLTQNFQQQLQQFQQIDPVTGQAVPVLVDPQQQQIAPPPVQPGVTPNAGPANFDPAGQVSQQLTAEDIAKMDMTSYAALRPRLGIGGQSNARGLYG